MDSSSMPITAACTIVSKNYLAYARTLCASFKRHNPEADFFVLLVDRNDGEIDVKAEPFKVIEVEDIGIPNFDHAAFKFDILEFNTNVKPTFLKFLFRTEKIAKLFYLDPDILVYDSFAYLYSLFDSHDIIITPHFVSPIEDDLHPSEQDLLVSGVFNLGFIGVNNSAEGIRFLDWWESRCLALGFNEPSTGLFVDQKWINLVPCFFESAHIVRHVGCNVAYWNLHERLLGTDCNGSLIVNGQERLIFYHFSGVSIEDRNQLSKYQNRYDFISRPDLKVLFDNYRDEVLTNGFKECSEFVYYYSTFTNGVLISPFARRLFSIFYVKHLLENPFDANGPFYLKLASCGLLTHSDSVALRESLSRKKNESKEKFANILLGLVLRLIGVEKYCMLMKYLSFISVIRNQEAILKFIFKK